MEVIDIFVYEITKSLIRQNYNYEINLQFSILENAIEILKCNFYF
jgi:hypothetical protein